MVLANDRTSLHAQLQEAKRRWNTMKPEKRQDVINNAGIIKNCMEAIEHNGRLSDKARQQALYDLVGVRSIQTLYNMVERCRTFTRAFPDEELAYIYALVKLSGRPQGQLLSEEQELLVLGAYVFGDWEIVLPGGETKRSREKVQVTFIYSMVTQLYPDLRDRIKPDYLARFIKAKRQEDPVLFTLAREGSKGIWRDYMPKLSSNVGAPNEQWISDARPLPFIALYKRKKCTVTLLTIIDQYSGYILAWGVIPRIDVQDDGDYRTVDFRESHVRLLFVHALIDSGKRPRLWYTDNGAQYKAIEPFLPLLTAGEEDEIIPIFGFPGHPWGRGKVEVTLREFNKPLKKFSGFVRDEDDRQAWKKARQAANVRFEELEQVLAAHVKSWNHASQDGKPGRFDLWQNAAQVVLPAPPLERIVHLASADTWDYATVSDMGLRIDNRYYKPKEVRKQEDYARWIDAAARRQKVPYCMIFSEAGERVVACMDGETWEEMILVTDKRSSRSQHVNRQWNTIKKAGGRLQELRERFEQLSHELMGGVPNISLDDEAVLPSQGHVSEVADIDGAQADETPDQTDGTPKEESKPTDTKPKAVKQSGRKKKPEKPAKQEETPTESTQAGKYDGIDLTALARQRRMQREEQE